MKHGAEIRTVRFKRNHCFGVTLAGLMAMTAVSAAAAGLQARACIGKFSAANRQPWVGVGQCQGLERPQACRPLNFGRG